MRRGIHSNYLCCRGFRFWQLTSDSRRDADFAMREIECAEETLTERINELHKLRDKLNRARKRAESGKQAAAALTALASELRATQPGGPLPDFQALATQIEVEGRRRTEQGERAFVEELKGACETAGVAIGKAGDALTVGPFALNMNWAKGVWSLEFGKVEVERGLSLVPKELVARVKDLSSFLLSAPGPNALSALGREFEEGVRVCVARRGGSLAGELRAELPALYREIAWIRHGDAHKGLRLTEYPMARFVVELKTLVQSDYNTSRSRRFRMETAVIENTKNPRKSVFVPTDLTKGFSEGTYFQAVLLTAGT